MNGYIKREDAKQCFCDNCRKTTYEKCEYKDTCASIRVLNRVPSADVVERKKKAPTTNLPKGGSAGHKEPTEVIIKDERKRGEWIKAGNYHFLCSKCECIWAHEFNYCPNCGAKMATERDNDEESEWLDNVPELENPYAR